MPGLSKSMLQRVMLSIESVVNEIIIKIYWIKTYSSGLAARQGRLQNLSYYNL